MDSMPLRRSLRVQSMTPVKSMNTIMNSEKENKASRGRAATPSKSSTPKRNQKATGVGPLAKQLFNLPSDVSANELLGDTPTARFYQKVTNASNLRREEPSPEDIPTAIARRVAPIQPVSTIKARRRVLNVGGPYSDENLNSNNIYFQREAEDQGGMLGVAILGTFRILGWFLAGIRHILALIVTVSILFFSNLRNFLSRGALIFLILFLLIVGVGYIVLQLEVTTPIPSPQSITIPTNINPVATNFPLNVPVNEIKSQPSSNLRLEVVVQRIGYLEKTLVEAKSLIDSLKESSKIDKDSLERNLGKLAKLEESLESRISKLSSTVNHLSERHDEYLITNELQSVNSRITSVNNSFQTLKLDVLDLKEKLSEEFIRNSIRRELADVLPQQLLVRRSSQGSIYIDPSLIKALQSHLSSDKSKINASKDTHEIHVPPSAVNQEALENFINGKLDNVYHKIVSREDILSLLADEINKSQRRQSNEIIGISEKVVTIDNQLALLSRENQNSISKLQKWLEAELEKRQGGGLADPTGMADFASESLGSHPLLSLTSPSYSPGTGFWERWLHGYQVRSPITALQSDTSPGSCWPFPGSSGQITVQLPIPLIPTHFSIDHTEALAGLDRSSAPKRLSIYAMIAKDDEPVLLGTGYSYRLDGPSVQTFALQYILSEPVRVVQLRIESNHGKVEFTCLYRLRLHSVPQKH